jgi:hypothetical protein
LCMNIQTRRGPNAAGVEAPKFEMLPGGLDDRNTATDGELQSPDAMLLAIRRSPSWAALRRLRDKLARQFCETIAAMQKRDPPFGGPGMRATLQQVVEFMGQVVEFASVNPSPKARTRARNRLNALGLVEWGKGKPGLNGRPGSAPICRLSDRWKQLPQNAEELEALIRSREMLRRNGYAPDGKPLPTGLEVDDEAMRRERPSREVPTGEDMVALRADYIAKIIGSHAAQITFAKDKAAASEALNDLAFKFGQYGEALDLTLDGAISRIEGLGMARGLKPKNILAIIKCGFGAGRRSPKSIKWKARRARA